MVIDNGVLIAIAIEKLKTKMERKYIEIIDIH